MKRIKKGKRLLAVALSVLLVFGRLPTAAFAEGQSAQITQGLCEHHLEHTAECGYVEGQPCGHGHSEDCYTNELTCGYGYDEEAGTTASDSEAEHTHTQECYAPDCPHERGKHDDTCGYEKAQPCGYACELCGKTDNGPKPVEGALVKTITSWTFVRDDNLNEGELPLLNVSMEQQADFDTVVSMLPTGISAEIEGGTETIQVDITG